MTQIEKVAFKTIGCKVNQYETGSLMNAFVRNGYQVTGFNEVADIYIVNTCAVTREAERKSKQMVRKAARLNPSATIIVTGCAVQFDPKSMKECVHSKYLILGNDVKEKVFSIFNDSHFKPMQKLVHFQPANQITSFHENGFYSITDRIRGLVKIQDGCNQFCSYCIIPYLRGRARSRSFREILSEIDYLISKDHKEIVLLGINLGSYGSDLDKEDINLSKLIKMIDKYSNLERIRLSSIELPYFTNELIRALHDSVKICHHLHIPLQSGENRILSLMRRKYTVEQFKAAVNQIRKLMPDVAITTDVIVGFPGEDEESFKKTFHFIKEVAFAKIHVFPYSDRYFNLASLLPSKVKPNDLKIRSQRLFNLSKQLHREFLLNNQNQKKEILVESEEKHDDRSYSCGITDNYIKVCVENVADNIPIKKGEMVRVRLQTLQDSYYIGDLLK